MGNSIGVATQNNPNAIAIAHQSHLVAFIIDELKSNDLDGELMNKLIFTLSAITRQSDVGLRHLQRMNGVNVLYKCGKILSNRIDNQDADYNLNRALIKLLTMISDIVVLNGNKLEYS